MGWEQRQGQGHYYVRKRREGKHVRSIYVGTGEVGEMLASFDAEDQQRQRQQRQRVQIAQQHGQKLEVPVGAFCQTVDVLVAALLPLCGYHRPKRADWRKKRMGKSQRTPTALPESAPLSTQEIVNRAQSALETQSVLETQGVREAGSPKAEAARSLTALREQIQAGAAQHPEVCQALYALLDRDGRSADMTAELTSTAIQLLNLEPNLVLREAFTRQMQAVRQELGWEGASALERLLIERIVVCGYALHQAQMCVARMMEQDTHRMAEGEYLEGKVDRAHKRYLAALKALAEVRKLKLPQVQVNIGEKQINVL